MRMSLLRCGQTVSRRLLPGITRHWYPLWHSTRQCSDSREKKTFRFVPSEPVWSPAREEDLPPVTRVDMDTVKLLERLSLVDFRTEESIAILEDSIRYVDELLLVDTTGVEPMTSFLEEECLMLREDEVTEGGDPEVILRNAKVTREGYFVAPPGNRPMETGGQYDEERLEKVRTDFHYQSSAGKRTSKCAEKNDVVK